MRHLIESLANYVPKSAGEFCARCEFCKKSASSDHFDHGHLKWPYGQHNDDCPVAQARRHLGWTEHITDFGYPGQEDVVDVFRVMHYEDAFDFELNPIKP